jgi:tetratricopeptide (TPR) repeat protein
LGSIRITSEHQISDADVLTDWAYEDDAVVATYERFVAQENWDAAAEDMRETIAAASRWPKFAPLAVPLLLQPRLVYALARGGHQQEAVQNAATLPQRCYRCARARGWVATMGKDWRRADQEFSDAVRQAPSLPMGYFEWGASLLQRGNPEAAIRQFAEAHKRGPRFADPLEMWGEALMKQNRSDLALTKFEEAEKYAPNWGRLHLKWGEALGYAGYKDEAQKQYQAASRLDLSATDKAELARQIRG